MVERVELKASDGVAIIGDYYQASGVSARGLLLLHMMPAVRASWKAFAEKAQSAGFHVLAVDLRGHGESQGGPSEASLAKGGPDGYRSFSDAEHQASQMDVEAGAEFLKGRGAASIYLGGASIGANLALQYLAEYPEAKAAFLLSPGLDYRGIKTEGLAAKLGKGQGVYYAASRNDGNSYDAVTKLVGLTPPDVSKEMRIFDSAGHGTTIFEREPQFMNDILLWLNQ